MAKKKVDYKWAVLWESLKEPLRLLVLGLISWLLTVIIPQIDEAYIPAIVVGLRFIDKYLHNYSKETGARVLKLPF